MVNVEYIKKMQKKQPNWFVRKQTDMRIIYRWQIEKRKKIMQEDIKSVAFKGCKLLEIGCGDGRVLEDIAELKLDIQLEGCDYNPLRIDRARKLVPEAKFWVADIITDKVKKEEWDIIICNHTLEHIKDDVRALEKIKEMLKPGGYLFIGIPQEGTKLLWVRDHILEPYLILWMTDHVQFYTDTEILDKLKQIGFKVESIKYMDYSIPHSVIDRWLRRSKTIHDSLEYVGSKTFRRAWAGALWLRVRKN